MDIRVWAVRLFMAMPLFSALDLFGDLAPGNVV